MDSFKVLGIMSGTSLDGLDLAYCHLWQQQGQWQYKIKNATSVPYSDTMRESLKTAIQLSAIEHLQLHNNYGKWLGDQVNNFRDNHKLKIDFVASHGHTSHHQPDLGLTYQLGSGQHLANTTGLKTICDFRTNDVALGGQGAPLVPIGDDLLFGDYNFCLNLGGISNISFKIKGERIAYDIGLANMILNYITQKEGIAYDKGGGLARSGKVNNVLLEALNALPFYTLPFPKSTGYEWFLKEVVPLVEHQKDSMENLLCSAVHHISDQVSKQILQYAGDGENTLLVTGGGALNTFLTDLLREKLGQKITITVPDKTLINFKEALVFALMGVLRHEEEINVLSSVTGASANSSSGVVYLPS